MAKGQKTGGRNFKPGQSGNPDGRPVLSPKLRKLKKLNEKEFINLVSKYLRKTAAELKAISSDKETKSMDLMVIALIIKTINHGDYTRLNFLLDRTIGKVKVSLEHTGKNGGPIQTKNENTVEKMEDALRRRKKELESSNG